MGVQTRLSVEHLVSPELELAIASQNSAGLAFGGVGLLVLPSCDVDIRSSPLTAANILLCFELQDCFD